MRGIVLEKNITKRINAILRGEKLFWTTCSLLFLASFASLYATGLRLNMEELKALFESVTLVGFLAFAYQICSHGS